MAKLFAELKRRHIYRVAAAYVVVAWLLLQFVNNIAPGLNLPNSAVTFIIVLLAVGFPVALIFAWIMDLGSPSGADEAKSKAQTTRLDGFLAGALVLVLALVSYQQLTTARAPSTAGQPTGVEKARAAADTVAGAISVAVLPFENLSGDPEQEFFSAGMTEEITSALAKIPDLRVVARTSAFQFKDQKRDIQAIAQTLRATHFVEGSVRKAGTRLRITAQLVNAANGVSIWSDTYDREYTDVFAVQEDIATAIAGAFRMPLGLKSGERLVNNRTDDLKAYEDYLRVRTIGPLARSVPNAAQILEQAVAKAPNFAPAWSSLASLYSAGAAGATRRTGSVEDLRQAIDALLDKAEQAARKAIELDPRHASGYGELGRVEYRRLQWAEAEAHLKQALALDPDDPETLQAYGLMLGNVGRLKEGLQTLEKLLELEPFVPIYNYQLGMGRYVNGQNGAAIALLEAMDPRLPNYNRNYALAAAYAATGQYEKAADTLLLINSQVSRQSVEDAARLLRSAPTKVAAPGELPFLQADLNFVYAHVGALERVMEFSERGNELGVAGSGMSGLWQPFYAPLRKTDRFKAYVRRARLVDYWRKSTWPDLCRPVGADDFVCD